ncbi:hypothetical protein LIER_04462 [Lithospermum erythrorhizon]|uniref:TF-B3 domain-containing protein n=1 Tax=Lithospermum erythrorhizon TaxID=34254 RepID=A0AAV3NYF9_LITER
MSHDVTLFQMSIECLQQIIFYHKYLQSHLNLLRRISSAVMLHIKLSCLKRRKRQILEGGSGAKSDGSCNFPEECTEERATGTENTTCFEVILKPCNTIILVVPSDFARMNMPRSSMFIKLFDDDDNEWEVRYTYHKSCHNLNEGWTRN